jgi:hypothetical protein
MCVTSEEVFVWIRGGMHVGIKGGDTGDRWVERKSFLYTWGGVGDAYYMVATGHGV